MVLPILEMRTAKANMTHNPLGCWPQMLRSICVPTLFFFAGSWGGNLPPAKEKERKKENPYLLGGNFFAVTSPLGSASNKQEQRINQYP